MQNDQPHDVTRRKSLNLNLALAILALIVIAGVGAYFWDHNKKVQAPLYIYNNTATITVAGKEHGTGMSFSKPVELEKVSSAQGQVELEHLQTLPNGKKKMISYIAAASSSDSQVIPQGQLDSLNKQLTDVQNFKQSSYSLETVNTFLKDRLPEGWQTSLSHGYAFTNGSIKRNAWYFNVTSKDQKTGQELDGRVVYAISQGSHYYYFTIIAQPNDWQSNASTWNSVLSSLKIDQ